MSQNITKKFIKCHNYLIENGIVHNSSTLAGKLGIFRQFLSKIINGKGQVTLDMIQKMIDIFYVNPNYIFGEDTRMFLNPEKKSDNIEYLPGLAFAGEMIQFQNDVKQEDIINFSLPGTRFENGEFRAFTVKGDSMEPYFYSGNMIICSGMSTVYYDRLMKIGGIYVLMTKTEILVKRFNGFPSRNQLSFRSDNPAYSDILVSKDELKEIWKVEAKLTEDLEMNYFKNEINKLSEIVEILKGK
jgi:transcriptional regulator with XRE-family HTH domain